MWYSQIIYNALSKQASLIILWHNWKWWSGRLEMFISE